MQKRANCPSKVIICCFTLVAFAGTMSPAKSSEVRVDGLPCNDLCQTWLGYDGNRGNVESFSENTPPVLHLSIQQSRSTPPEPLKSHRHKTGIVKTDSHEQFSERPTSEPFTVVMTPRYAGSPVRVARENIPLPTRRPTALSHRPTLLVKISAPPTPRSHEPAPKPTEAATVPATGRGKTASLDPSTSPAPDRPADTTSKTDRPDLQENLARAAPPAGAVASTPPASERRIAATPWIGNEPQPPSKMSTPATPSVAGGAVAQPSSPAPLHLPPAPSPPTVVASLPSSDDTGSIPRSDGQQGKDTQVGALQPSPSPAGISLSVKIGQVSADSRGTNVHVVVVNMLPKQMENIDVRCKARDAQGLQVAEVNTRIAVVAPSDITFDQVLFPNDITPKDNTFICDVANIAVSDNVKP